MTVLSGIGGKVDGIDTVRTWSINHVADLQAYIASNTKGGTSRLKGNLDWTGQYTAYGHTPVKMPGDIFTFIGSIDGSLGVTAQAMVEEVTIIWDIEAGNIIGHEVSFGGDADLVFGSASATDVTLPNVISSISTKLELSEALLTPAFSEITDIRTMTLTLTRSNQSYVSSSTSGITKRIKGNLDVSFSYTLYEATPASLILPNAVKHAKLYVDSSTFWELKWVRFGELSGLEVDIESGTLVGPTQNTDMEGFTDIAGVMTEGKIVKPDLGSVWP